ncbi:ATP-binding protein [Methanofollis aquaemaris]|uniref:ATP-binding protein n=1 Tax=Methanofollis aquaemaris TaxID=126734 RepID=A0A8A3S0C9_9EURY|nr:ATP-binding protein [Methanofollis aquaemaris]QSZ66137.1 ATP-binding protein [Methanofollis aquaemaris]
MTDLLEHLVALNPWWSGRAFETGVRRERYLSKIKQYLASGEIVALSGVRRAGKTTLLYQMIHDLIHEQGVDPRSILFVNCDEPVLDGLDHPLETVLDTYRRAVWSDEGAVLVFDEIQNVPGWERWVKAVYDRNQFGLVISGSSSHLLDTEVSTLISGRYLAVPVYPLDFREYLLFQGCEVGSDPIALTGRKYDLLHHLRRYLREGGFPQTVRQKEESVKIDQLRAYYDSIVYRDIVRVNEVRNQRAMSALLSYLLTNIASPYSYRQLEQVLGIEAATIREYIHYAGMAMVLFEVRYFSYSLKVQARNNKKIYCIDTGLRNAVSFTFSADEGRCVENLVFLELRRRGYEPYYWKKRGEVDFVLKNQDNTLTAINVTSTDALPEREMDALREFAGEFGGKVKDLVLITKDTERTEGEIRCVPLWKWLLDA